MQESLGRESYVWAVGSLCALHRIPFNADLILRRFTQPYDIASLEQAAFAYDFKVTLQALLIYDFHPASLNLISNIIKTLTGFLQSSYHCP